MIFRLLSNLGSRFLPHNKSLRRNSTAAEAAPPHAWPDFLIHSLGFSKEEALSATKKVRLSKAPKNDPNLVVNFFENLGLDKSQIKKVVSTIPRVLMSNVDKTLRPKIQVLENLGFTGSELVEVLATFKSLLARSLNSQIIPSIEYLRNVLGSDQQVVKVILRCPYLLHSDTPQRMAPNLLLLQEVGFSMENVLRFMARNPRVLLREPEFLGNVVKMVENEFRIPRHSKMFYHGVVAVSGHSVEAIQSKLRIFKSFGWSEENITIMLKSFPYVIGSSEARLRKALEFFTGEIGYSPDYLASHPVLFNLSLEKRVKPRIQVLKVLREKGLIKSEAGMYHALVITDLGFLEKFVLPHKEVCTSIMPPVFNLLEKAT